MKTERATLLTSRDFKAFLDAEARLEGVCVAEWVRSRCERRPSDEEAGLAGWTKDSSRAVGEAQEVLNEGLDEGFAPNAPRLMWRRSASRSKTGRLMRTGTPVRRHGASVTSGCVAQRRLAQLA
jgi:hypothetical protein